jgi:hypothetical protein
MMICIEWFWWIGRDKVESKSIDDEDYGASMRLLWTALPIVCRWLGKVGKGESGEEKSPRKEEDGRDMEQDQPCHQASMHNQRGNN